ncbi:tRNA epoxyqueuosine(34) reductase QueG [Paenibacillus sp. y28]|uniref:tRNA epoxyqueuosine(34) reductase QueG n=1 Tax=Paenibacillus sp. y28 TaxID=3129110 RepID=UPI003016560A
MTPLTVSGGTPADWAALKREVRDAAQRLGIDKIGFASADPFVDMKGILQRHRELGYESGFEEPDLDKRTEPSLLLERPQSMISIAVAYPSKLNNAPKSKPGATRGMLSRSAWGEDYHQVLRRRLERLAAFLRERVPDVRLESMVDTGALVDRAAAQRAGVGWSAKNCCIITPEFGSWVYLGEMITDIPFEPDAPLLDECGDCTLCIDSCPTGALVGPGQLNAQRCISFITQTKGFIADDLKLKIGNRLYGCDTCQIVCPKNKGMNWTHHPELQPDPELAKPLLVPLLELSNRDFKERFGHTSSAWRGRKPIQRNAVIALGFFRDATAAEQLVKLLRTDPRAELREAAAWALGRIGGELPREGLSAAQKHETDPTVLDAIRRALLAASPQPMAGGSQADPGTAKPAEVPVTGRSRSAGDRNE